MLLHKKDTCAFFISLIDGNEDDCDSKQNLCCCLNGCHINKPCSQEEQVFFLDEPGSNSIFVTCVVLAGGTSVMVFTSYACIGISFDGGGIIFLLLKINRKARI